MPTEGGRVRDALVPAVQRLPELLYRGPNERDRPLTAASSGAPRVCGHDREPFEDGEIAWGADVIHPADRETAWLDVQRAVDAGEEYDVTYRIVTANDETRWVRDRGEGLDDGTLSGYVEDVTRLKEREERLATELDETFERVSDAFFALDDEWRFTYVNERAATVLDRDAEELLGAGVRAAFENGDAFRRQYERAMATQEPVTFTAHYEPLDAHFEVSAYPSETGLSVYFRDVSERVERERRLECHEAIVETVWDGVYAVDGDDRFTLVNDAYCDLLGVEREDVLGRPAVDVVGDGITSEARRFTEEMRANEREEATISFAIERDGETRQVEVRFGPFTDGGRVGVLRDVTERRDRRRQLRRQRERLRGLVELYDVASDVSNAVVEQTTRPDIEERVVEELTDGPYAAAWIGRTAGTDVTCVASVGSSVAPEPDDAFVRTAVREGRVVTTESAGDGVSRANARSDGGDGASAGAVPISYEGGTYGVLVVCAERRDAFREAERTVLNRLGRTVGHAFAALDRRAALVSDHVVQVEYRSREPASFSMESDAGRFRFERTVATGEDEYVHYVRVYGVDRADALAAFADASTYESTRVVEEGDEGGVLIETRSADAPITSVVTSHGGRLRSVSLGSDGARLTAEFPQGVDLRTATESIRDELPDAELVAQR
ncbi:bacterio-opsin activator domain-containing protein, partial [Halarchaeum acidiphilum]